MLDEKVTIAYHKKKEIGGVQNCSGRNFLETDLKLYDIETIKPRFILLDCVMVPVNNFFEIFLTIVLSYLHFYFIFSIL